MMNSLIFEDLLSVDLEAALDGVCLFYGFLPGLFTLL